MFVVYCYCSTDLLFRLCCVMQAARSMPPRFVLLFLVHNYDDGVETIEFETIIYNVIPATVPRPSLVACTYACGTVTLERSCLRQALTRTCLRRRSRRLHPLALKRDGWQEGAETTLIFSAW